MVNWTEMTNKARAKEWRASEADMNKMDMKYIRLCI